MKKSGINNINCEEALKQVFDYIDHHLDEVSKEEFEYHIEKCRHCYDRVEFEKLLKSRIGQLQPKLSSEKLHKRIDSLLSEF